MGRIEPRHFLDAFRTLQAVCVSAALLALSGCGSDDPASPPSFTAAPEVITYPSQPMVVGVRVKLSASASVSAALPADPGVHVGSLPAPAGQAWLRLRGLAPATQYSVTLRAENDSGSAERDVSFETGAPAPGFTPSFEVTGTPSFALSAFDMSVTPAFDGGGLFAVDASGTTRFFLPAPSTLKPPDFVGKVPAGLKLLDDGRLLFTQDHHVRIVNELGEVEYDVGALDIGVDGFHHDALMLPSGNLLVLGFEFQHVTLKTDGKDYYVAGDRIVELDPLGMLVWSWSSFAHLDPQRVLADFNSPIEVVNPGTGELAHDWTHGNALYYRESDDSILLSMRHQDWILKIDHKSGDLLWRLGNEGDFTLGSGRWFFHQHAPEWEPDGTLLLYDNGVDNPDLPTADERSRPVRFSVDEVAKVAAPVWSDEKEKYACLVAGDARLLQNGHVVVLDSSMPLPGATTLLDVYARMREVDPSDGSWRWTLRTQDERFVFRSLPLERLPGEAR